MKIITQPIVEGEQKLLTTHTSASLVGIKIESLTLDRRDMQRLQAAEENRAGALAEWFAQVLCRF